MKNKSQIGLRIMRKKNQRVKAPIGLLTSLLFSFPGKVSV